MTSNIIKWGVVSIPLLAPMAAYAADNGIGDVTGTSTPQVVTPPTTAAPQTPANPSPPIGTTSPGVGAQAPAVPNRTSASGGSPTKTK
jgi:hypothetical protein